MTTFTTSRTLAIASIGLNLAAFGGASAAADELIGAQRVASPTAQAHAPSGASADAQRCITHDVTDNVLVGPDGHEFRLVYVPGYGCRYLVDGRAAVLLDGPNGYAFAWTLDTGWKILNGVD